MSASELYIQPDRDLSSAESIVDAMDRPRTPTEKSGVGLDPNALMQERKYEKGDTVFMNVIVNGAREKLVCTIYKARLHRSKDYYEYQVKTLDQKLYKDGVWTREKELKPETRRG